jgi:hypothetical protein
MNSCCSNVNDESCLRLITRHTASNFIEIGKKCVNSHHNWVYFVALEKLLKETGSTMRRIRKRFSDDQRTSYPFIRLCQFTKNVIVALFQQWKVKYDISFVGAFVVVLSEIKLIIWSVYECFQCHLVSAQIFVFWHLRTEGQLRTVTPFITCCNFLRSVVYY